VPGWSVDGDIMEKGKRIKGMKAEGDDWGWEHDSILMQLSIRNILWHLAAMLKYLTD